MTASPVSTTPPAEVLFALGRHAKTEERWLTGKFAKGVYFDEYLPACFDRTLDFDAFKLADGAFEWVLTGDEGGLTVRVTPESIELRQRFYGSFAAYDADALGDDDPATPLSKWFEVPMSHVVEGKSVLKTYPEKTWFVSRVEFTDKIDTLRLTVDHVMFARLEVNGQELLAQRLDFDFHQHQLRVDTPEADIRGMLRSPVAQTLTLRVDVDEPKQSMLGFGGTAAPPAYHELSERGKEQWWRLLRDYNLLIQRDNPIGRKLNREMTNWDDLEDATPHYYGDNFPNGNLSDFGYNRRVQDLGGEVWFEFWDLPEWVMDDPEAEFTDEKSETRRGTFDVERYAEAMVGYCSAAKEKTGRPPAVLGIQNEQRHAPETYHAMTRSLRRALDDAGFDDVKIHMSDANMLTHESTWGKLYADSITRAGTFTSEPNVWEKIDYAAAHMYDVQEYFDRPDELDKPMGRLREIIGDKPFLSSELCLNSPRFQQRTYRLALLMGEVIHKNLTVLDAQAVLFCWTIVNVVQPSFGWTRSLFVCDRTDGFTPTASSHQLRVFAAWSRYVERGMRRVACDSGHADLLATAFVGDRGEATVVLLNRSTGPLEPRIAGLPSRFTHAELADPYHPNLVIELSEPCVVPPGAILTLTNLPPKGRFGA